MDPMVVRYNRVLAIVVALTGYLLATFSVLVVPVVPGQRWIGGGFGGLLVLLGLLLALVPMLRITSDEVQVRSPVGFVTTRYPVSDAADLSLDGNVVRHVGQEKTVATLGFLADKEDVATLRSQLGSGSAE